MADPVAADPRIGTEFAGYRIKRVLGRRGELLVVYVAEDGRGDREVALGACPESRCLRSGRGPRLGVECLSSGGGVAVAMGVARTKEASRQIAMVCLDELVSEDDRFRRIDELVGDWGFVREAACPYYADGLGRPSIDPTVLL